MQHDAIYTALLTKLVDQTQAQVDNLEHLATLVHDQPDTMPILTDMLTFFTELRADLFDLLL